jgi:hypothetical protein
MVVLRDGVSGVGLLESMFRYLRPMLPVVLCLLLPVLFRACTASRIDNFLRRPSSFATGWEYTYCGPNGLRYAL